MTSEALPVYELKLVDDRVSSCKKVKNGRPGGFNTSSTDGLGFCREKHRGKISYMYPSQQ